jgi:hypothetical protein
MVCTNYPVACLLATDAVQVLFKRKPVHYLPRPSIEDDSLEASSTMQKIIHYSELTCHRSGSSRRPMKSSQTTKHIYRGEFTSGHIKQYPKLTPLGWTSTNRSAYVSHLLPRLRSPLTRHYIILNKVLAQIHLRNYRPVGADFLRSTSERDRRLPRSKQHISGPPPRACSAQSTVLDRLADRQPDRPDF